MAVTLVQVTSGTGQNSVTSAVFVFGTNVTAGNSLFIPIRTNNASGSTTVTSVNDSYGNSYSKSISHSNGTGEGSCEIWKADLIVNTAVYNLSAVANHSGSNTTYTGTFPSYSMAGAGVTIAGFTIGANNGNFTIVSNTTTSMVVNNGSGTAESHVATATITSNAVAVSISSSSDEWTFDLYETTPAGNVDQQANSNGASSTTWSVGPVTPSSNGQFILALFGTQGFRSGVTAAAPFTYGGNNGGGTTNLGGSLYLAQSTAAAVTPTTTGANIAATYAGLVGTYATLLTAAAANITGTSSVTANLTGTVAGVAAINGSSVVTANLIGIGTLSCDIAGSSAVTANLQNFSIVSSIAGTSAVSGTLSSTVDIASSISGTAIVSGTLSSTVDIASSITGSSSIFATPSTMATIQGSSSVTGSLANLILSQIASNILGTSAVSGTLHNATFSISGTVIGPGYQGMTMILSGTQNETTVTDSNGNYSFNNLGNGTYVVTPKDPGGFLTPGRNVTFLKPNHYYLPTEQNIILLGSGASGVNFTSSIVVPGSSQYVLRDFGATGASPAYLNTTGNALQLFHQPSFVPNSNSGTVVPPKWSTPGTPQGFNYQGRVQSPGEILVAPGTGSLNGKYYRVVAEGTITIPSSAIGVTGFNLILAQNYFKFGVPVVSDTLFTAGMIPVDSATTVNWYLISTLAGNGVGSGSLTSAGILMVNGVRYVGNGFSNRLINVEPTVQLSIGVQFFGTIVSLPFEAFLSKFELQQMSF